MKKIYIYFLLSTLPFSLLHAQGWLWAKANANNTNISFCGAVSVTSDNSGNIYEVGTFAGSISFGNDTITTLYSNIFLQEGVFLAKFDSSGNTLWVKRSILPTRHCSANGYAVTTDNKGYVYITGSYCDTVIFGSDTLKCLSNANNVFNVKYDSKGNVLWAAGSQTPSARSYGYGYSIAADTSGNTYITGPFNDTIFFDSTNRIYDNLIDSGLGVFIVKYNDSGKVVWTMVGRTPPNVSALNNYNSCSIGLDNKQNVLVTGIYENTISFDWATVSYPQTDVFLVKLNSAGKVLWLKTSTGGTCGLREGGCELTTDSSGNVYITGQYSPYINFGIYRLSTPGNADMFLVKYDTAGNVLWAKNGNLKAVNDIAQGYSLKTDEWNHIYLSGAFQDTLNFDSVQLTSADHYPSFIDELNTSGEIICATVVNDYSTNSYPNNLVTPSKLNHTAYFSGLVYVLASNNCIVGNDTVSGIGQSFSFLAEWEPCTYINKNTAVDEVKDESEKMNVYPNPSNGNFNLVIASEAKQSQSTIEVYNMLGEKVYSQFIVHSSSFIVNLSGQPNGVYLYRVITETGNLIGEGKIIIQK